MGLLDDLEKSDKKGLFSSDDNVVNYPTGIMALDAANGYYQEVHTDEGTVQVPMYGITGGTFISVIGSTGSGKAQPDDTPIPTPDGIKRLDEIEVGDFVFDATGNPTRVLGVYPQGIKDTYEVTFVDGRKTRCCDEHLWTVLTQKDRAYILPLSEMMEDYEQKKKSGDRYINYHKYYIPTPSALQYNTRKISIDPWTLGVFLGDGYLNGTKLQLSSGTSEIPERVAAINGWEVIKYSDQNFTYMFKSKATGKVIKTEDFLQDYPELIGKLSGTKFIPEDYLYNNIPVRLRLLSGLMDTDGYITDGRGYKMKFSTTSRRLKDDFVTLVRSLGFFAYISEDSRSEKYTSGECFEVIVTADPECKDQIFTATHKYVRAKKGKFESVRRILYKMPLLNIEYVGKTSQRCIYVDNPLHLYITEDCIVTHNTTFADQLGWNIIKDFEDGVMYHIDAEKTSFKQRIIDICGTDYNDPRIKLIKNHTSIEDVQEMFNKICDAKEAGGDLYKYEIKDKSLNGKPFKHYIPTVFIIDSLPSFNSKEYNVEDLGNNIDQMRAAKDVTRFYTNCLDRAWKYNVTFIVVNHIRPKADMNPYAAPPRGLLMLGPQETLPRGQVAQYYSQTFIRINNKKSDAYTMEDNGFTGYKCTMQLAKTKSNVVGTSFPVAFISDIGFDPIYSIYEFASSIGMIGGRNPYLYFQGLEEFKFNRKDFRNKMIENVEFRNAVLDIIRPHFEALLGSKKNLEEEAEKPSIRYGELTL